LGSFQKKFGAMPPKATEVITSDGADETVMIVRSPLKKRKSESKKHEQEKLLPWYRRGGMKINIAGMGINIFGTIGFLLSFQPDYQIKAFVAFVAICVASSLLLCSMRTMYCILIVPLWMSSTLLAFTIPTGGEGLTIDIPGQEENLTLYLSSGFMIPLAIFIAIGKVNICMSVSLHRYAAHSGFKCGPITDFFIKGLGCLAVQGGPIWWSSMHRRHHTHCDGPYDPHSPALCGIEKAFAFFEIEDDVTEEFVPRQLDTILNRVIDTWAWTFVWSEICISYLCFGRVGMFLSFISGMACQSVTLWFNVANHPPEEVDVGQVLSDVSDSEESDEDVAMSKAVKTNFKYLCQASNGDGRKRWKEGIYFPFYLLDLLIPVFGLFVMEGEHKHHHDHPKLAKRSKTDVAYWLFLWPLELVGLVWDIRV